MKLAPREPSLERKRALEARLQRRPWLSAGLLIALLLAVFILPLIWLDFITALAVQVCGAGFLYIFGRWFTTAFASRPRDDDAEEEAPGPPE